MSEIVQTVVLFGVMGALCWALERLWPEDATQPQWRHDSTTDVAYFVLRIVLSALAVGGLAITGYNLPQRGSQNVLSEYPLWVQAVVVLFLSDFISYWVHRLMHVTPSLWNVHAIHHSAEKVDWLVASRVHPVELVLQKLSAVIVLQLAGFSPATFAPYVPLVAAYSVLLHANFSCSFGPLGYVFVSPAFHRWHHSAETQALDKNFAQLFSMIDFAFGTAYFPKGRHSTRYGLHNSRMPDGFGPQLLYPLRRHRAQSSPESGLTERPSPAPSRR